MRIVELNYCAADDQIIFRRLQKQKQPGLSPEQFQNLFAEWRDLYNAKCARDRQHALENIATVAFAKRNPTTSTFRRVCGGKTTNPLNSEFEKIHREHIFLAQFDKAFGGSQ